MCEAGELVSCCHEEAAEAVGYPDMWTARVRLVNVLSRIPWCDLTHRTNGETRAV